MRHEFMEQISEAIKGIVHKIICAKRTREQHEKLKSEIFGEDEDDDNLRSKRQRRRNIILGTFISLVKKYTVHFLSHY